MSPLLAEQVVGDAERSFRREAEQAFWFEHHRSVATSLGLVSVLSVNLATYVSSVSRQEPRR